MKRNALRTLLSFALVATLSAMMLLACSDSSSVNLTSSNEKCLTAADCPPGSTCDEASGMCIFSADRCEADEECRDGYHCNTQYHFCEFSCEEGQIFFQGECMTPECTRSDDCAEGEYCNPDTFTCTETPIVGACEEDADCDFPKICIEARCTYCRMPEDCEDDEICVATPSGEATCTPITCGTDADCRNDYWCHLPTNSCKPPCEAHEECDEGLVCLGGKCQEVEPECQTDYDCPNKKLCTPYNLCERGNPCANDVACDEGRKCDTENNYCIPSGCTHNDDCSTGRLCDPVTHECVLANSTGSSCGVSQACLSTDLCYRNTCVRQCDPYQPMCQNHYVCAIVTDAEEGLANLCLPQSLGQEEGEHCNGLDPCKTGLLCHRRRCSSICEPNDPAACTGDLECLFAEEYQVGLCQTPPCNPVSNPCPQGLYCHDGYCVTCATNDHCPDRHYCDMGECKPSCIITGCPEEETPLWCNSETGRCEEVCYPACEEGYMCQNGGCVPAFCDPPCDPPFTCELGSCVTPPDCREFECPDPRWICNYETGQCEEPDCPPCAEGQCCSELTDYQCSWLCYTCSEETPDGTCPPARYCKDGICRDVPCAREGKLCGAASEIPGAPCCGDGELQCCEVFPGAGGICCQECGFNGTCAP